MPVQLVHDALSRDTAECLVKLLEGAHSGVVVGAVVGIMMKRKRYSITVCGEAYRDPTYARGIVGAIEDELRELIHTRAQGDTTL